MAPREAPSMTPGCNRRTLVTFGFTTWLPSVTCPSAISTTSPSLRTHNTVVACTEEEEKVRPGAPRAAEAASRPPRGVTSGIRVGHLENRERGRIVGRRRRGSSTRTNGSDRGAAGRSGERMLETRDPVVRRAIRGVAARSGVRVDRDVDGRFAESRRVV